jgi:hypothetical protein
MFALSLLLALFIQPFGVGTLAEGTGPRLRQGRVHRLAGQLLQNRCRHLPVKIVGYLLPLPELAILHRLTLVGGKILVPQPLIHPIQPFPRLLARGSHPAHNALLALALLAYTPSKAYHYLLYPSTPAEYVTHPLIASKAVWALLGFGVVGYSCGANHGVKSKNGANGYDGKAY